MKNGLLAAVAVAGAALLAGACGAARHAPRPYPGPPPVAVEAPEPADPSAEVPAAEGSPAGVPRPAAEAGEAVAALALSLQGVPYANGGADPGGFDCSGFVQYVYARAGVAVPRSVREQFEAGREVDGAPQPGDLVFFAIDGGRVSHVGIATGPDTFVHAPSRRGVVREDRLSAPYWSRRYAGARRLVAEEIPD